LPLQAWPLRPEVHQDDPDAVECVEQHRPDQTDLHEVHDRGLVGGDDIVIGIGGDADQRGVQNVHEEEEEDRHAGDPVSDPGPHTFVPAVQSADGSLGHSYLLGREYAFMLVGAGSTGCPDVGLGPDWADVSGLSAAGCRCAEGAWWRGAEPEHLRDYRALGADDFVTIATMGTARIAGDRPTDNDPARLTDSQCKRGVMSENESPYWRRYEETPLCSRGSGCGVGPRSLRKRPR